MVGQLRLADAYSKGRHNQRNLRLAPLGLLLRHRGRFRFGDSRRIMTCGLSSCGTGIARCIDFLLGRLAGGVMDFCRDRDGWLGRSMRHGEKFR